MTGRPTAVPRQSPRIRRPRIGMALYGDLTYDSRVRKEARTLAIQGYDVSLVCLAFHGARADLPEAVSVIVQPIDDPSVLPGEANPFRASGSSGFKTVIHKADWLRAFAASLRSWGRAAVAACGDVDAWHANDLSGLAAIVPSASGGVPVVYDAHELYLETGTASRLPRAARALLRAYERRLTARTSAVITVSDELADLIRRRDRGARVEVIHNCPELWTMPPTRPDLIRKVAGIPRASRVVLYHGSLSANRGIDLLLDATSQPGLEDVHVALLGFGPMREGYRAMADQPAWRNRVHILNPVPASELLEWVASADVGAMPNPGNTLNDVFSAPNKLFECLAAGTPVVASDVPTMRRVVLNDPSGALGALCDPSKPGDLAAALQSILRLRPEEGDALRARCHQASVARWNWESEAAKLGPLYASIIGRRRVRGTLRAAGPDWDRAGS